MIFALKPGTVGWEAELGPAGGAPTPTPPETNVFAGVEASAVPHVAVMRQPSQDGNDRSWYPQTNSLS